MVKKDEKPDPLADIPHERKEPRPDFSTPPPRKALPKTLQETLDSDEKLWELITDGHAPETTDTSIRYAAYASRIRTILLSAHRYVAYTSDIGESFRPIAHPWLVRGAYGISWLYLAGDVGHEGYKAWLQNQQVLNPQPLAAAKEGDATSATTGLLDGLKKKASQAIGSGAKEESQGHLTLPGKVPAIDDYRAVMVQRAVFQSIASMGLPAFTIHSIVRYSGRALKDAKNKNIRTWGPIGLGLAAIPFLPYAFDEPVERAVEWTFHKAFETFGGPEAVGHSPTTGRERQLQKDLKAFTKGEKEL